MGLSEVYIAERAAAQRVIDEVSEGVGGCGCEDCYRCNMYLNLLMRLDNARGLQPVDNPILQDIDDAISALLLYAGLY